MSGSDIFKAFESEAHSTFDRATQSASGDANETEMITTLVQSLLSQPDRSLPYWPSQFPMGFLDKMIDMQLLALNLSIFQCFADSQCCEIF